VLRDSVVVHEGRVASLRRIKEDVEEVAAVFECGIGLGRYQDIKEGDVIESFLLEEVAPRL
jgi:translation initiation factor IF-2